MKIGKEKEVENGPFLKEVHTILYYLRSNVESRNISFYLMFNTAKETHLYLATNIGVINISTMDCVTFVPLRKRVGLLYFHFIDR